MSADEEWDMLARRLVPGDGQSVAEKLQSYRDGSNPDLQRWRAIGGAPYVREPSPSYGARADGFNLLRNHRIAAAARTGTCIELIADRFGISKQTVRAVLDSLGERAIR